MSDIKTRSLWPYRITYYFTGIWAEPTVIQRRVFTTVITVVVLIGLYCMFTDAPFSWLL